MSKSEEDWKELAEINKRYDMMIADSGDMANTTSLNWRDR